MLSFKLIDEKHIMSKEIDNQKATNNDCYTLLYTGQKCPYCKSKTELVDSSYVYGKAQAEKRAATRLPRQGNNSSKFKSFLRFAYYYMDYIFGRSYIFFKYQIRNYIVLYDRYYFDFIVDGKRTNIEMDEDVPKWLYRFVQKPKLNFFLYAPVDVILQRKKELEPEAIRSLTQGYQSVFNEFGKTYPQEYHSIKNIEKEETLNFISQELIKAF